MPPSEQQRQLKRVRGRIGHHVYEWCCLRARDGSEFSADQLLKYVLQMLDMDGQKETARPGSPDRIMRDLRKRGVADVENTSRAHGLYRVHSVRPMDYVAPIAEPQMELEGVA